MNIIKATEEDFDSIVKIYASYDFAVKKKNWFNWKYLKNPYKGTSTYKIKLNDKIVGAISILPRKFYYRGRQLTCYQAVDGLMGYEIRGKGFFTNVLNFIAQANPCKLRNDYFSLGFVSLPASINALASAGWHRLDSFYLYTFFLSADFLSKKRILRHTIPVLSRSMKIIIRDFLHSASKNVNVYKMNIPNYSLNNLFSDEKVFGDRSEEFLKWRVMDNPMEDIYAFKICDKSSFKGYVIYRKIKRKIEIIDIKYKGSYRACLSAILRYLFEQNIADSVDCWVPGGFKHKSTLIKLGFIPRMSKVAIFAYNLEKANLPFNNKLWEIAFIDSDW